jgi:hypothetical protein
MSEIIDYSEELREAARSLLINARKHPEEWRRIFSRLTADDMRTLGEIAGEADAPEERH